MLALPLLQVVAVGLLILANAFFVAAEFAMVSTRDTRIEQLLAANVPGARAVRRLQLDLEYFLPAVQLGVTLCSLAIGWIGEPLAAGVVLGWLNLIPHPQCMPRCMRTSPPPPPSRSDLRSSPISKSPLASSFQSPSPSAVLRLLPSRLPRP